MGRPKKIIDAKEWNAMKEAEEKNSQSGLETGTLPTLPVEQEAEPKAKKVRKVKGKVTVDDVLKEFETKKQKLVNRYIKKVHKLMGI